MNKIILSMPCILYKRHFVLLDFKAFLETVVVFSCRVGRYPDGLVLFWSLFVRFDKMLSENA